MKPHRRVRRTTLTGLVVVAFAIPLVAGCGSDGGSDGGSDTVSAPAATQSTPSSEAEGPSESTPTGQTSEDMASNVESLSYLMQGLLTTPQIGGGWVDMGRVVVPPSVEPTIGPLCPDGQAIAEPIGTALNVQVHTTYQRLDGTQATASPDTGDAAVNPSLVGGTIMESLLWNERQQVDEAFAAMAAATEACIGTEFTDPDMGDTVITSFDAPTLGTDSFTSGYMPVTPPTSDPWIEVQGISILLSDPSSPVSVVLTVSQTVVHNNPDQEVAAVDTDELIRIAEVAVARIMDGL
jgi:hypothetical protein